MGLKLTVNQSATAVHTWAKTEAQDHPTAQADHPHAYCRQYVGMSGAHKVINISAGGAKCPKGFSLLGYVSDATRTQLLSSGSSDHASAAADHMVRGGLNVQKAGLGGAVASGLFAAAGVVAILASDPAFVYGLSATAATGAIFVACVAVAIVVGVIAYYALADRNHGGSVHE